MLLLQKRLIRVYWNMRCALREGMAPFHVMAQLKQNSAGKDLDVTNINTKAGPQIVKLAFYGTK